MKSDYRFSIRQLDGPVKHRPMGSYFLELKSPHSDMPFTPFAGNRWVAIAAMEDENLRDSTGPEAVFSECQQ